VRSGNLLSRYATPLLTQVCGQIVTLPQLRVNS
jgi:hypothetical protein